MIKTQRIYQVLMIDKEFVDWFDTKSNKTKDKVRHLNLNVQFLFFIVLLISICISEEEGLEMVDDEGKEDSHS